MSVIPYDQPVKDLIAGLNATKHVTHQIHAKTSVTLHHNDGVKNSHEQVLNTWKTRPASAHFDVDFQGAIAQYVIVDEIAWGVGNWDGNLETISIEMADAVGAPTFEISTDTLNSAARLAGWLYFHVVKQPPTNNNFFQHNHFVATDCPGPYVKQHWSTILSAVQHHYQVFAGNVVLAPAPKTVQQLAAEVMNGKWGNGQDRINRLKAAGYNPTAVQAEVNKQAGSSTAASLVSKIAGEIIEGLWGDDPGRTKKLLAAGYSSAQITLFQHEVNHRLS